jgi:signal transduction histidine kinase
VIAIENVRLIEAEKQRMLALAHANRNLRESEAKFRDTAKSSGVGMGLSICRSIIEAHGGRLWADANESRGAVFQFTLPTS